MTTSPRCPPTESTGFRKHRGGSVYDRRLLVASLAQLGRFAEPAEDEAELIRLALAGRRARVHRRPGPLRGGLLHLLKGDWVKARSLIEHGIAVLQTGNVALQPSPAVAFSTGSWRRSARRASAEPAAGRRAASRASGGEGIVVDLGWDYHALGRPVSCSADSTRRGPGPAAVESSPSQPGYAA